MNKTLTVQEQLKNEPNLWPSKITITAVLLGILLWSYLGVEQTAINPIGGEIVKEIALAFIQPTTKYLFGLTASGVPLLIIETLGIAFLGTLFGALLSLPFAFLAARNIAPKVVSFVAQFSVTGIRVFPAFVFALIFVRIVGMNAFAGVLTIAITSIGMITKLFVEAIEDIDKGVVEALDATGCTGLQKIRYGIIPQLSNKLISTAIYRFEINVKNASILGLVGAGGIGTPLMWAVGNYRWNDAAAYLIGLILIVIVIETVSTKVRKKLS